MGAVFGTLGVADGGDAGKVGSKYDDVIDSEFPGYENDASRISVYLPLVLPPLLQTRAYIEAFMRAGTQPPAWRERALDARLRRQQILERKDGTAPRLNALITEASLMYRWGSQADRRAQLARLADMSRRPSIELRLLPFAAGPHPGMLSSIHIFDFPDDEDPSVVYLENDATAMEVTRADEVSSYTTIFGQIRDAALPPAATTTHLEQLTKPCPSQQGTRGIRNVPNGSAKLPRIPKRPGAGRSPCEARSI